MVNLTLFPYHKSHDITHWYDLLEHVICLIWTLFKGREFSVFCLSMCVFVSYNFNGIPDMFVLQAEYFHKRLFPGTPWMHSIQLLWKCTSSAVFCRVPQMHISCSSFAKFLHLIFLHIHHWIPLVFFSRNKSYLILSTFTTEYFSFGGWHHLIQRVISPETGKKIFFYFRCLSDFHNVQKQKTGRLSNCGWICICHKYLSPIIVTNICHQHFSNISHQICH